MNTTQINRQNLINIAKNINSLSNSELIKRLKDEGVKIRINHYRLNPESNVTERYKRRDKPFNPLPHGGETGAVLKLGDKEGFGVSSCYYKDTFSYKIGTRRSIIEALHNLIKRL